MTSPENIQLELQNLRLVINKIDELIIQSIARRMSVSCTIGAIKKENRLKIKDPKREKELQQFYRLLAKKNGITYATLKKIFKLIMKESRHIQK